MMIFRQTASTSLSTDCQEWNNFWIFDKLNATPQRVRGRAGALSTKTSFLGLPVKERGGGPSLLAIYVESSLCCAKKKYSVKGAFVSESVGRTLQTGRYHASVCVAGGGGRSVCRPRLPEEVAVSKEVGPLPRAEGNHQVRIYCIFHVKS